jgi:predicted transcriptional regulator
MAQKEVPTLGELEARVLQLVWDRQPCTERLLSRQSGDGPILWRAAIERNRAVPVFVRRFVDGVLGGSAEPLVAYLAGQKQLSAKDVAALQRIADKLDNPS